MFFHRNRLGFTVVYLLFALFFGSCAGAHSGKALFKAPVNSIQGSRDNRAVVHVPAADGIYGDGNAVVSMDTSHTDEGYIMVSYNGSNSKVKLQLTPPDDATCTYTLHGGYETFPLTGGNGIYSLKVFENISDDQYSLAFAADVDVIIDNEFGPYLYPNQYVSFSPDDQCIHKGEELAYPANNDLDVVTAIYNYITDSISYDKEKAASVDSGYLPVPDETLNSGKGICFDYASLMAAMLRSQQIPTRLEVGYAGTAYHAWISVHITDIGWLNGIIEFDGTSWKMVDPTLGASNKGDKEIKRFIGDGSNYTTKYIY